METENTSAAVETPPELKPTVHNKPLGPLNRAQMEALNVADMVGGAAQNADYALALAGRDISPEFTRKFRKLVEGVREQATALLVSVTVRRVAIINERRAWDALAAVVKQVQMAAKQKYARTNRPRLDDYLIGTKWERTNASLAQASQTVLGVASTDTLPGINARLKGFQKVREEWVAACDAVAHATAAVAHDRDELAAAIRTVNDQRFTIQAAAAAEWPHGDESNRTVRLAFGLNPSRQLRAG
ncbi:MAG TPA: hypothetical protein VEH04_18010 [Verrucomicrobiae bacterium]|nr:hypothetical protein [Verrucomicrobiae bacterium]